MKQLVLLCLAMSTLLACDYEQQEYDHETGARIIKRPPIDFRGGCFVWEDNSIWNKSHIIFTTVTETNVEGSIDLVKGSDIVVSGKFKLSRNGDFMDGNCYMTEENGSAYTEELNIHISDETSIYTRMILGKFPADHNRCFYMDSCDNKIK